LGFFAKSRSGSSIHNLPAQCTIYIFSLSGDKVKTIEHYSDNGTETWDMRTAGNREIAPGV